MHFNGIFKIRGSNFKICGLDHFTSQPFINLILYGGKLSREKPFADQ